MVLGAPGGPCWFLTSTRRPPRRKTSQGRSHLCLAADKLGYKSAWTSQFSFQRLWAVRFRRIFRSCGWPARCAVWPPCPEFSLGFRKVLSSKTVAARYEKRIRTRSRNPPKRFRGASMPRLSAAGTPPTSGGGRCQRTERAAVQPSVVGLERAVRGAGMLERLACSLPAHWRTASFAPVADARPGTGPGQRVVSPRARAQ